MTRNNDRGQKLKSAMHQLRDKPADTPAKCLVFPSYPAEYFQAEVCRAINFFHLEEYPSEISDKSLQRKVIEVGHMTNFSLALSWTKYYGEINCVGLIQILILSKA